MITQRFDLNLIPDSSPVVVHCDQYDTGTGRLIISLYEGSVAYSPSGTVTIQGSKPDGKGFSYDASLSGNVVTADLKEQMSIVAGRVRCQVVVSESTGRTGTFVFILDVQPSALPSDEDMSESEYQFIEHAIEVTGQAVIDAEAHAEDAEAWAVGERGGVPVTSGDPTYNNNSYYWAQYAAQHAQGGYHYQGAITFANLPTTGMSDGDIYNITDDFVTDNRFIEGAGIQCFAGQNVAWESNSSKWDLWAVFKAGALDDLTDVDITSPTDGQYLGYNAQTQEFENKTLPTPADMTSSTKGIGKPDGKTTEVSSGTFNAIGVSIPAEVNSGGTQYGSNWLYYEGTTEVITPSTKQNYRVIESGTAKLYYWTGSAYAVLSGGGGGGGMNTDGSNADATVGFTNTNIFTIGDRTGKSAAGRYAVELGNGANATGTGSIAIGTKDYCNTSTTKTLSANTTTETLAETISLISYPYQAYSLFAGVSMYANIAVAIDGGLSRDKTIIRTFSDGVVTVRLTQDGNNIKVYYTNTCNAGRILYYGYQSSQNKASGEYSYVEGSGNKASGRVSHAEGQNNTASGYWSHVEGDGNTSSGYASHAEGRSGIASGNFAHTEGESCTASGVDSHAEGRGTTASSNYQHVSGKYNVSDNSDTYAVIVGNGTYNNNRSNAMTLDWDGNLMAAGRLKDANGQIYDKTVALTQSEYQQLVDNDEDDPNTEYYIEDVDVAEAYYVETSGQTAITGATSLTFTNSHITPTSDIRIIAEPASCKVATNPQYKVSAKLSSVGSGTATITFPALAENTTFWLLIECPLAITVDPAYVYNTDETVIGQWIDGKTLYRKVFEMNFPASVPSGTTSTVDESLSSLNIDKIVKSDGILIASDNGLMLPIAGYHYPLISDIDVIRWVSTNTLYVRGKWNNGTSLSGAVAYITLEYTKN